MKFNKNFLQSYISMAPIALAIERSLECNLYIKKAFERPILDIGCGDGLFAKILFQEKIDTGIDPDQRELDSAEKFGAYAELIKCEGSKIPKPDNSYKTIFSNSVLEHIPDISPVLDEIHRLLSPDGIFYMTVPSDFFDQYSLVNQVLTGFKMHKLAESYRNFYNKFWKHSHFYSLDEWIELAKKHDFTIQEAYTYDPKCVTTINDFLVPFGIFGFITKKFFNRWVLFPGIKKILTYPLYLTTKLLADKPVDKNSGGLVFLSLKKAGDI